MKVLLIGYSRIAQRRVLPGLLSAGATIVGIASMSNRDRIAESVPGARAFDSYDEALVSCDPELVYVSTVNSRHAWVAERALQLGFHVVVDKPSFLAIEDAVRLIELAKHKGRCLAEAVVFPYHPRVQSALQLLATENSLASIVTATFSFPPLPDADFRYVRELGGGALWDLGPYAAACGRVFFRDSPVDITTRITSWKNGVDDAFSVLATFAGGRVLVGSFGYRTSYANTVEVMGTRSSVRLDRVFSPPEDIPTDIAVQQNATTRRISVGPADTFACFFTSLFQAIKTGRYEGFMEDLLWDARTLHAIRGGSDITMAATGGPAC